MKKILLTIGCVVFIYLASFVVIHDVEHNISYDAPRSEKIIKNNEKEDIYKDVEYTPEICMERQWWFTLHKKYVLELNTTYRVTKVIFWPCNRIWLIVNDRKSYIERTEYGPPLLTYRIDKN